MQAQSSPADWHTTVDWDWRMKEEVDGSIEDLPLMRKWLQRVRGRIVTAKPQGLEQ